MQKMTFSIRKDQPLKLLCLGAHSDDIEIGCGGTILRLLTEYNNTEVHWVVLGSNGQRDVEASVSANRFLADAGKKEIIIENYKDGFFPYMGGDIKNYFEELKRRVSPDIIFTHARHDLHQDHRLVSELTWNTFRNHLILEYEVIKYDGDIGVPNVFVHLSESICRRKVDYLLESFLSQKGKPWFTEDAFLSILRIRGIESNSPEKHSEGFYCRKLVI